MRKFLCFFAFMLAAVPLLAQGPVTPVNGIGGCQFTGTGAITCTAKGTNQNITLKPSGTGLSICDNCADKGGQVFNVKAYGAKGDGVFLYDGVISSGSPNLSSATASWTSADVGKDIEVDGAGAAGAALITTISSVTNATHVVLAANASTSVASNGVVVYGTDDTSSIQTLINSTVTAGGGTLFFPKGVYILDGALGGPQSNNAILQIPQINYSAVTPGPLPTLELRGATKAGTVYGESFFNLVTPPTSTAVLYGMTAASGSYPAIIGGPGTTPLDSITVVIDGLVIRGRNNPDLTAISLYYVVNAAVRNATVDVNVNGAVNPSQPTNSQISGISLPESGNYGTADASDDFVVGYYRGIQASEHAYLARSSLQDDWIGVQINGSNHVIVFNNTLIQQCPFAINFTSAGPVVGSVDIEDTNGGAHWYDPQYNVSGGGISGSSGYLKILRVIEGVGPTATLLTQSVPNTLILDSVFSGQVGATSFNADANTTTITGTTAGTAVCSQSFTGVSYKKSMCHLSGYENTTATAQTYTFPTAFASTPYLEKDDSGGSTVSTTVLTLPASMGATKTGWVTVEGN